MNNTQTAVVQPEPLEPIDFDNKSIKTIRDVDRMEKKLGRNKETLIARGAVYFNLFLKN